MEMGHPGAGWPLNQQYQGAHKKERAADRDTHTGRMVGTGKEAPNPDTGRGETGMGRLLPQCLQRGLSMRADFRFQPLKLRGIEIVLFKSGVPCDDSPRK